MSIKNGNVRWAFDLRSWRCTLNELELATSCIQAEEKERLMKFHFIDDFKASIIGRLMMRQFIKSCLPELNYNEILLERDSLGKPFFQLNTTDHANCKINFNVSHHERYTVLSGSFTNNANQNNWQQETGVDVMKIEYDGGKPLSEFFRLMHRIFTPNEWNFIKSRNGEREQTAAFMRYWSLKESYTKNIGVGINMNLQSMDFNVATDYLSKENVIRNTKILVYGEELTNWLFEESLLDNDHCVAVAVKNPSPEYLELPLNELRFEMIDFERIMRNAKPLLNIDTGYCRRIQEKQFKKQKHSS